MPSCERGLNQSEKSFLIGLLEFWSDSSSISDTTMRAECREARLAVASVISSLEGSNPKIFIGTYHAPDHIAVTQADRQTFHVDSVAFYQAMVSNGEKMEMLATVAHESLHLMPFSKNHSVADQRRAGTPPDSLWHRKDLYDSDPYFRTVHSESGGFACLRF